MSDIKAPGTYAVRVINASPQPWYTPGSVEAYLQNMATGTDCSEGTLDETTGTWTITFAYGASTVVSDLRMLAEDGAVSVDSIR